MEGIQVQRITTFGLLLLPVLAVVVLMYFNFTTVVVSGNSMEPTYHNGERLLASKAYWLVGPIKKGDIVVVKNEDGSNLIKRVHGMAGDKVDFFNVPESWKLTQGEYRVPEESIYVLGDNREASEDSRRFGPVTVDNIIGKVIPPR